MSSQNDQPFWQLGLILSSGFGLISIMVGAQIAQEYGAGSAILSILIGNLILWFIGLGILSMTSEKSHLIQTIKDNLGNISSLISAIIIIAAFLIWYAFQIQYSTDATIFLIKTFIHKNENLNIKVSLALGIACTLIGMGGIRSIKWVNIGAFPILIFCLLYFLFQSDEFIPFKGTWNFSLAGIILVVLTWFPGTVNLSAFFRHSRSRAHSCLGLTLMSVFHAFFQCCFVFIHTSTPMDLILKESQDIYVAVCFIVLTFFCVNLLNIYWASVGWEVFFKHKQGSRTYAIIGLSGTLIYVFFHSSFWISFIENLGTIFIANLGSVLIASYILKMVIRHRPRYVDKLSNSICWFVGCLTSIVFLSVDPKNIINAVLYGMSTSLIAFCIIMFIEETVWSIQNLGKT